MRAALTLAFLVVTATVAVAQPDFSRAAELYKRAETEMAAGQYIDAASDYAEAYDVTKDPVLFFKIASADDKGGRCDLALTYYRRYLKEGNPTDEFKTLTEGRIKACESGSSATTTTTGAAEPEVKGPEPGTTTTGTADTETGAGTGAAEDSTAALSKPSLTGTKPSKRRGVAWITLGVGIALGTIGVVSALSAEASEKDLDDLFDIRVMGRPPEFTAANQDRYDDLVKQGDRYQKVSWVAFGAAGVAFAAATVLFLTSSSDNAEHAPPVSIQVTGSGAAVAGGFRF